MNEEDRIKRMMDMEALERVLGKERIQQIAEEALKNSLSWILRDRKTMENVIFNASYQCTLRYIADECGEDLRKHCVDAIRNTLEKADSIFYYMFSSNKRGMEILNEEIEKARPYIQESLRKSIDQYTLRIDREDIEEMMWEYLLSKMLGDKILSTESMSHETEAGHD